MITFPRE